MSIIAARRLRGVYAPVVTPFHGNQETNIGQFIAHCEWLVQNGVGLAIFGTNSEANSLSVTERIQLTEELLDAGVEAGSMMPGTGSSSITDAVTLTRHAVTNGAPGVLVLPPFFYKNVSDDGLFAYYSEIIERVGDSRLALYLYHIPALSGAPITLNLIERLLEAYPESIAGVKDSSGDWNNTKSMIDEFAKQGLSIFPASEAFLSEALSIGGAGCISATANVNPRNLADLFARALGADGKSLQERATQVRSVFQPLPMIAAMKHVIAAYSGREDWRNVRPPLTRMDSAAGARLLDELQRIDFEMPGIAQSAVVA